MRNNVAAVLYCTHTTWLSYLYIYSVYTVDTVVQHTVHTTWLSYLQYIYSEYTVDSTVYCTVYIQPDYLTCKSETK